MLRALVSKQATAMAAVFATVFTILSFVGSGASSPDDIACGATPIDPVSAVASDATEASTVWIDVVYQTLLGRYPTDSEQRDALADLVESADRAALPCHLLASAEYADRYGRQYAQAALGENEADQGWGDQVLEAESFTSFELSVLASNAYLAGLDESDDEFLTKLFAHLLTRAPDAEEQVYWVDAIEHAGRASTVARLYNGPEYARRVVTQLHWVLIGTEPDDALMPTLMATHALNGNEAPQTLVDLLASDLYWQQLPD